VAAKRSEEFGQSDLFASLDDGGGGAIHVPVPDIEEWERAVKLKFEIEMLGLSISDHLLRGLDRVLSGLRTHTVDQLTPDMDHQSVTLCGLVSSITRRQSRQGDLYAMIDFDDRYGQVRVNAYRKVYTEFAAGLEDLDIVQIEGRVSLHDDLVEVSAVKIRPVAVSSVAEQPLVIQVPGGRLNARLAAVLASTLRSYPGSCDVKIRMLGSEDSMLLNLDPPIPVDVCDALISDLKALLGPRCIEA
jgi:DNA polymerase-3 subunit alpha